MDERVLGAAAVTGMAVWELVKSYSQAAPALCDLRESPFDTSQRQQLLDADMMVGGVALLAGVTGSWLARSWVPMSVIGITFLWLSCYHHLVLRGPTSGQI